VAARGARFGDSLCGQFTGSSACGGSGQQVSGEDLNCSDSGARPVGSHKAGRLSAHKLTSGTYVIYPGELLRVFPLESSFSKTVAMAKLQGFGFPAWDVS